MSNLISGKEAKLAWANGDEVQYNPMGEWEKLGGSTPLSIFKRGDIKFRLKPRTITLNGIEVPAPFEPKEGDLYWMTCTSEKKGYGHNTYDSHDSDSEWIQFGAWRTEEEIKQVVEALRSVFK